jgi:hypothetical protein
MPELDQGTPFRLFLLRVGMQATRPTNMMTWVFDAPEARCSWLPETPGHLTVLRRCFDPHQFLCRAVTRAWRHPQKAETRPTKSSTTGRTPIASTLSY